MGIRVLVADDQQMVRTGFRMIVDSQPDGLGAVRGLPDDRHVRRPPGHGSRV